MKQRSYFGQQQHVEAFHASNDFWNRWGRGPAGASSCSRCALQLKEVPAMFSRALSTLTVCWSSPPPPPEASSKCP
jgi:hypothetical protein